MEKNFLVGYVNINDPYLLCVDEWYLPDFSDASLKTFRRLYSAHCPHRIIVKIWRVVPLDCQL